MSELFPLIFSFSFITIWHDPKNHCLINAFLNQRVQLYLHNQSYECYCECLLWRCTTIFITVGHGSIYYVIVHPKTQSSIEFSFIGNSTIWFNKHSEHHCAPVLYVYLIFISSSNMLDGGNDVNDKITFWHLHSNVSSSLEYKSILPPGPSHHRLLSWTFPHSVGKAMHFSIRRKALRTERQNRAQSSCR